MIDFLDALLAQEHLYILRALMNRREIDSDLKYAFDYNPCDINLCDISFIAASISGEADGANWYWLAVLNDGRFAYIEAGCCYTGWD